MKRFNKQNDKIFISVSVPDGAEAEQAVLIGALNKRYGVDILPCKDGEVRLSTSGQKPNGTYRLALKLTNGVTTTLDAFVVDATQQEQMTGTDEGILCAYLEGVVDISTHGAIHEPTLQEQIMELHNPATGKTLGLVRVGEGLTITPQGTLSVNMAWVRKQLENTNVKEADLIIG